MEWLFEIYNTLPRALQILLQIVMVMIPLMLCVAYLTFAERKILGYMHVRLGPNRVGPKGWLQPIADAVKLMFKEIIIPTGANKYLFLISPVLSIAPALAAWAVIPFDDGAVLANVNAGLLYVLAVTSIGVYGVIIAGWASNSKYALLGAMRSAAQIVAYEIAMGFALVGVLMAAGSLNLGEIVNSQKGSLGFVNWFVLPLLPLFVIYFISGIAETNRAPFDVAEGESEIVAGFHVEYSGMAFAVFFLAEYANMILIATLTALMFLGGWLSPVDGLLPEAVIAIPVVGGDARIGISLVATESLIPAILFLVVTSHLPALSLRSIMRLGWKVFIPITIVWLLFLGLLILWRVEPWFAS